MRTGKTTYDHRKPNPSAKEPTRDNREDSNIAESSVVTIPRLVIITLLVLAVTIYFNGVN